MELKNIENPRDFLRNEIHYVNENYSGREDLSEILYDSEIEGIQKISGKDENITVFLEDPLDISVLRDIEFERLNGEKTLYYLERKNVSGEKFWQMKKETSLLLSRRRSIVALDKIKEKGGYVEIRRDFHNRFFGGRMLGEYLDKKYGGVEFK